MIICEKSDNNQIINERFKSFEDKIKVPQKDNVNLKTKDSTKNSEYNKKNIINRKSEIEFIKNNIPYLSETFEIQNCIGKGSSGVVYKGIHKKNKKQVAIKFFINEKGKEKREQKDKNQAQEIALSKKLHHKNIIEMFAYNKTENVDYSIIEFGKYGDLVNFLKNLLKRGVFSETTLNYIATQILEGLNYLHRSKTVHLDIKPENILIDAQLEAKIIDFSVSCPYGSFHPEDLVRFPFVGTGKFMAPEIIDKTHMKIKEAEKIDVYSLGATLYYLFFGDHPYELKNVPSNKYEEILKNIKEKKLEFPKDRKVSEKCKDFFCKTLEKDYLKRITIREALNHPWIQGSKYIFEEKENTYCLESFLIKLITDNIPKFNEYIK